MTWTTSPPPRVRKYGPGWFAKIYFRLGGVASGEAHGTTTVFNYMAVSGGGGVPSGEHHGNTALSYLEIISPDGVPSGADSGNTNVAVSVSAGGESSDETHGSSAIGLAVTPGNEVSDEVHGTESLTLSTLAGDGPSDGREGSTNVGLTVSAGNEDTGEDHGTPALSLAVSPGNESSAEDHGTSAPSLQVTAGAGDSGEDHGSTTLLTVLPLSVGGSVDSAEDHGTLSVQIAVGPGAQDSTEGHGNTAANLVIAVGDTGSGEDHGTLTVSSAASTVIPYTSPFLIPASVGAHYTDDFNRSNAGSLGANWNTDAAVGVSLIVSSNVAIAPSGTGSFGGNIYTLPMVTGDNQITVVMKGTATVGALAQIVTRCDNATDTSSATKWVALNMNQGSPWTLFRNFADTGVSTGGNVSWADGDTIVFTAVGGTLTVKQNGSTVLSTGGATDLSAGYVEIAYLSADVGAFGFDSFDAQDI